MTDSECNQATAVRRWIGDVSANRVGHVWQRNRYLITFPGDAGSFRRIGLSGFGRYSLARIAREDGHGDGRASIHGI
jgi:hypothetical protein